MKMLRLLVALTLITGVAYPLAITLYAQVFFDQKAQGSLIVKAGQVIGSELIAQKFTAPEFFHPRPSAGDYATVSSGASQHSPTHNAGLIALRERQAALPDAQIDMWTTSGSGLDPHISPESAYAQVARIAAARGVSADEIKQLIQSHAEPATLGIWGRDRVNVLELNLAIMELKQNADTGANSPRS